MFCMPYCLVYCYLSALIAYNYVSFSLIQLLKLGVVNYAQFVHGALNVCLKYCGFLYKFSKSYK